MAFHGAGTARARRTLAALAAGSRAHHRRLQDAPLPPGNHAVRVVSPFWRLATDLNPLPPRATRPPEAIAAGTGQARNGAHRPAAEATQ